MSSGPSSGFVERTLSSFRSRNFRLFFAGQTISNTGNWLTMVTLTLLVLHRTGSGVSVGLLSACQFGPILFLSAWAGVIADRHDKRKLLLVTQSVAMCQSCALAILAFMHDAPLGAFYAAALVGGCTLAFDNPLRRSFVNEMVPLEDVPNAVTLYSVMVNLARIIGPALAGLLIVTVGYGWCFAIDAASYLAVISGLLLMRASELRRVAVTPRGAGQVRAGIRYIAGVPELWVTFAMLLIVGTLSYNFTVVFPLFAEHGLHGGDRAYTMIYSCFSAGALTGALVVARRTDVTIRTVALGCAWLGASLLVLSLTPDVAIACIVAVGVGGASIAFTTAVTSIAQIRTDQHMIGRVLAIQSVLVAGTTPLGGPLLGALADVAGARWPLVVGGVAALLAAVFGVVAGRRSGALLHTALPAK